MRLLRRRHRCYTSNRREGEMARPSFSSSPSSPSDLPHNPRRPVYRRRTLPSPRVSSRSTWGRLFHAQANLRAASRHAASLRAPGVAAKRGEARPFVGCRGHAPCRVGRVIAYCGGAIGSGREAPQAAGTTSMAATGALIPDPFM